MVNESDCDAKDEATIERYVQEKLTTAASSIETACVTFCEERLYPLDQGLNKVRSPIRGFGLRPLVLNNPFASPQATLSTLLQFINRS